MQQLKLDLQFFAGEKTEKATPKKRQDERRKGRVTKSQDVNTSILLLFTFLILIVFANNTFGQMLELYRYFFTNFTSWELNENTVPQLFNGVALEAAKIVAPILIAAFIAGVLSNLLQVGFLFTTEPLKMDLKRLDPIQGAKRIFSIRALVELAKSFLKIVLIGLVTFSVIWMFKDDLLMIAFSNPENSLGFLLRVLTVMGFAAIIILFLLAVLDYLYQRFDYEKNMRMSKQDIKDEYKNMEGDPLIKSKIKERQREMATRRMMSEVPNADVVITNPTHYAIAIKYDEQTADAPYILAKGTDLTAKRIREKAKEHDVMIVEDKPLARSLYAVVDVGDVIPEQFYQAIAEILAYVYQQERKV